MVSVKSVSNIESCNNSLHIFVDFLVDKNSIIYLFLFAEFAFFLKNLVKKVVTALLLPVLAGISRKVMVYRSLSGTAETALNGTTVLNTMALLNGASILRVHDVKEAARLFLAYQNWKS